MPASRSLIALLVGTVVFFALWMVALKPGSSNKAGGGASSSQGLGGFKSDIAKAHHAVATSNASNAASGNENAPSTSGGATASAPSAPTSKPSTSSASSAKTSPNKHSSPTTGAQKHTLAVNLSTVEAAVKAHKVVALLFYNPQAADDQAVRHELASVPTHRGQVVKLAIPLTEAAKFTAVTQQVPVNLSPTLVLVSRTGDAGEIVGYSDSFEIDQRVANALSPSGSAAS